MTNPHEEVKLSVSKTKCFEQCKKQFHFTYIQKLPRKEHSYHIFGKFCHKVLEDFYLIYINGSKEPYNKTMSLCFKNARAEFGTGMTPQMTKDCFDIINRYLKVITEENASGSAPHILSVEKNFMFHLTDNVILNGMIDRIQMDADNVLHVADYKSTKNKKYLKNDWFQLLTYAYVMIQENPEIKKIRASYILLRHDFEYITTEFDVPQIMAIKDKYIKYAQDIMSETEYKANPTILCNWCDHQEICPEGMAKSYKQKQDNSYGEMSW